MTDPTPQAEPRTDPTVCEVCGRLADGEPGRCHLHFRHLDPLACPVCAAPVRLVSADEGTNHYEYVASLAPEWNAEMAQAFEDGKRAAQPKGLDVERLRQYAEAALTDVVYHHGSDFSWEEWPGVAALHAELAKWREVAT